MAVPQIIKDVGFEFRWDNKKVWQLELPITTIPIQELTWHFDIPFWFTLGGKYDLKPTEVLQHPDLYPQEIEKINTADLAYPLDIMRWKHKWLLLDGLHRLVKLHQQSAKTVRVRIVPHKDIPKILSTDIPTGQSWINPKAQITNSPISGDGLFALEDFGVDEVLVVFNDEYTDRKGAMLAEASGRLVMQWDEDLFSVETRGEDNGYFINHSCDSNLWMEDAYTLIARKPIKAGEEITADYALWEADADFVSKWQCGCGATECRGKVTGNDWKIPKLQDRYAGHFSPLINKKIKNLDPSLGSG